MRRHELTESQFEKISHLLPGRQGSVGVTAKNNRIFLNGIFWLFKTGATWRDLPERYGCWKNAHRRFSRWSKKGVFDAIFRSLSDDDNTDFLAMDGTLVKAHQHASGASKKNNRGISR